MERVIGPIFKRPNFGPAEFYVQDCDLADPSGGHLCEVRLTGVTRNPGTRDRPDASFDEAREELIRIYKERLKKWLIGGDRAQLMVTIMLDEPYKKSDGSYSTLAEGDAIWVEGENSSLTSEVTATGTIKVRRTDRHPQSRDV